MKTLAFVPCRAHRSAVPRQRTPILHASCPSSLGTDGARIAFFVHGRGRGHAARARPIVSALRARGHEVQLFAADAAYELLCAEHAQLVEGFQPGPGLLRRFVRRVDHDLAVLRSIDAEVLVTDGDAPSLHAAAWLGVPSVAVGHGLAFLHADLGPLPRWTTMLEAANAGSSSYLASRKIAVHFGPARARTRNTTVAHAFADDVVASAACDGPVVAYFRDGPPRDWLAEVAAQGVQLRLFSATDPGISGICVQRPSRVDFALALGSAAGIVGSSGSNLCAEAVQLGIPMLALHAASDREQELNARILERLGLGTRGVLERPDGRVAARFAVKAHERRRALDVRASAPRNSVTDAVLEAVDALQSIKARKRAAWSST